MNNISYVRDKLCHIELFLLMEQDNETLRRILLPYLIF